MSIKEKTNNAIANELVELLEELHDLNMEDYMAVQEKAISYIKADGILSFRMKLAIQHIFDDLVGFSKEENEEEESK